MKFDVDVDDDDDVDAVCQMCVVGDVVDVVSVFASVKLSSSNDAFGESLSLLGFDLRRLRISSFFHIVK